MDFLNALQKQRTPPRRDVRGVGIQLLWCDQKRQAPGEFGEAGAGIKRGVWAYNLWLEEGPKRGKLISFLGIT